MRKVNFYAEQFHKFGDWELVLNGTINANGHRDDGDIILTRDGSRSMEISFSR
jgi:hypothetical protein